MMSGPITHEDLTRRCFKKNPQIEYSQYYRGLISGSGCRQTRPFDDPYISRQAESQLLKKLELREIIESVDIVELHTDGNPFKITLYALTEKKGRNLCNEIFEKEYKKTPAYISTGLPKQNIKAELDIARILRKLSDEENKGLYVIKWIQMYQQTEDSAITPIEVGITRKNGTQAIITILYASKDPCDKSYLAPHLRFANLFIVTARNNQIDALNDRLLGIQLPFPIYSATTEDILQAGLDGTVWTKIFGAQLKHDVIKI